MKRYYLITLGICLLVLLAGSFAYGIWDRAPILDQLKVGGQKAIPVSRRYYNSLSALL